MRYPGEVFVSDTTAPRWSHPSSAQVFIALIIGFNLVNAKGAVNIPALRIDLGSLFVGVSNPNGLVYIMVPTTRHVGRWTLDRQLAQSIVFLIQIFTRR